MTSLKDAVLAAAQNAGEDVKPLDAGQMCRDAAFAEVDGWHPEAVAASHAQSGGVDGRIIVMEAEGIGVLIQPDRVAKQDCVWVSLDILANEETIFPHPVMGTRVLEHQVATYVAIMTDLALELQRLRAGGWEIKRYYGHLDMHPFSIAAPNAEKVTQLLLRHNGNVNGVFGIYNRRRLRQLHRQLLLIPTHPPVVFPQTTASLTERVEEQADDFVAIANRQLARHQAHSLIDQTMDADAAETLQLLEVH